MQVHNLQEEVKLNISFDDEPNLYIRDSYLKDFKYISPEVFRTTHKERKVGKVLKSPKPKKSLVHKWCSEVTAGLKQFFYQGSLHGVKYIFEPSFSRCERFTWVILVASSVILCGSIIVQLISRLMSSTPFVNVIDSLPTPIWAVPFPSVVLCPHLHVSLSFANVSKLDEFHKFAASRVCPQMALENLHLKHRMNERQNEVMQDFIVKASPKCSDIIKTCSWRGVNQQTKWMTDECCEVFFKPMFTNYGLCYTFNGLPLNGMTNITLPWQKSFNPQALPGTLRWDLDHGYPKVFPPDPTMLPYRVTATGESNGLELELFLNKSEYQYACDGNSAGFNLFINSPINHAYVTTVLRLPMDRMTTIEVNPITYKTDPNLRSLSAQRRQCFFQNERKLKYFEFYTGSNCKHDMLIQEAVRLCNCVPYNWPRNFVWEPVCSTESDYQCMENVVAKVEEQLIYSYFAESEEQVSRSDRLVSCFPPCNDIIYSSQVYYSDFVKDPGDLSPKWGYPKPGETTRVNVHFYNDMFLGQHRHAQYDDNYFVGAIGGLLSLFMGFSIISVAEFIYFVLLRPFHVILKICLRG